MNLKLGIDGTIRLVSHVGEHPVHRVELRALGRAQRDSERTPISRVNGIHLPAREAADASVPPGGQPVGCFHHGRTARQGVIGVTLEGLLASAPRDPEQRSGGGLFHKVLKGQSRGGS